MWPSSRRRQRGSLIVITAWAVSFLTASAVTLATRVSTLSKASDFLRDRARAERAAESAVARLARVLVEHPELPLERVMVAAWGGQDDAATGVPHPMDAYRYDDGGQPAVWLTGLVTEEERGLNVNTASASALSRLVQQVTDHDAQEADAIASAILDWRDADDYVRLDGAESSYYEDLRRPYRPKNGPIESLEELSLIKGLTPEDARRLRPALTIYGTGQVNVMTADPAVLRALGISEELTDQILRFRAGNDGVPGTPDDPFRPTIQEFIKALKAAVILTVQDEAQMGHLVSAGELTTTGSVWRVRLRVAVGAHPPADGRLTECVVDRTGRVLAWHE